jgi:hypothetical protein
MLSGSGFACEMPVSAYITFISTYFTDNPGLLYIFDHILCLLLRIIYWFFAPGLDRIYVIPFCKLICHLTVFNSNAYRKTYRTIPSSDNQTNNRENK